MYKVYRPAETENRVLEKPLHAQLDKNIPRRMGGGHYATSRNVAGSIPVEVIGFFN
jgi:hypothetical protein